MEISVDDEIVKPVNVELGEGKLLETLGVLGNLSINPKKRKKKPHAKTNTEEEVRKLSYQVGM